MKASDAQRVRRLVRALDEMGPLRKALENKKKNFTGSDYRAVEFAVTSDVSEAGSSPDVYAYLPLEVGDILLPQIEEWLRTELRRLGVDPDA